MNDGTKLITATCLKKQFGNTMALNGVSFDLERGGQYAIVGESGSGKSTLLYLLGGLDRADSGEILLEGRNLASISDEELAAYRNQFVGFVFQFHFLLPSMNSLQNILLPAQIGGFYTSKLEERVKGLCETLGVDHCYKKFPFELSGGEQQRINIIRALSLRPKLLLCDEPTGNLDSKNSEKVVQLLKKLAGEQESTLVVVTHDEKVASALDSRIQIRDGKLL